jgi:hypothetical protein
MCDLCVRQESSDCQPIAAAKHVPCADPIRPGRLTAFPDIAFFKIARSRLATMRSSPLLPGLDLTGVYLANPYHQYEKTPDLPTPFALRVNFAAADEPPLAPLHEAPHLF